MLWTIATVKNLSKITFWVSGCQDLWIQPKRLRQSTAPKFLYCVQLKNANIVRLRPNVVNLH